jgi:predicted outer membrane repeat protein
MGPRFHCILLVVIASTVQAGVIFVDVSATGANDGTTWPDAFVDLDDALSAASAGDEIWIADGTYYPPSQSVAFLVPGAVKLYGGFAGGETLLEDRDPATNLTILDGDFNGDDQTNFVNRGDNAHHVLELNNTAPGTRLDGLVVTGGFAPTSGPDRSGGGLSMTGGTVSIDRCLFIDNGAAFMGGAISLLSVNSVNIRDTVFTFNATNPNATAALGGALAGRNGGDVRVEGCTFALNLAAGVTGSGGGAVYMDTGVNSTFVDCLFFSNTVEATTAIDGGAVQIQGADADFIRCRFLGNQLGSATVSRGGAVMVASALGNSTVRIVASTFLGNSAESGGAIYIQSSDSTLRILDSVVAGNTAELATGGIAVESSTLHMTNCTVALNNSILEPIGAGISGISAVSLIIENSILWGNDGAGVVDEEAQIIVLGGVPSIDYSCVQGWTGALGGSGNFGDDPLLVDPDGPDDVLGTDDDVYFLSHYSPCIDAGDNTEIPSDVLDLDDDGDTSEVLPLDIYLRPRQHDDIDIADTGAGVAPIVDVGAVEAQFRSCPADLTEDGVLDFFDVQSYLNLYAASDLEADFTGDDILDFFDVLLFLAMFSAGCP